MVTMLDDDSHAGWILNYTFHDLAPLSTYRLAILPHGDITTALDAISFNSSKVRLVRALVVAVPDRAMKVACLLPCLFLVL